MITFTFMVTLLCALAGYLLGRRSACAAGVHRGPYTMTTGLLNRQRPWCWHIAVHCGACDRTVIELNLDERNAERELEMLRGL